MTARRLIIVGPLAYLAIFFLYPLGAIFERSFEGSRTDLGPVTEVLVAAAVPLIAYLFAHRKSPEKTPIQTLSTAWFLAPVVATAIVLLVLRIGVISVDPFNKLLGDSYYLGRIWFTIWQATVSTMLTVAIGLPVAYLFAKHDFPGKSVLKAVSTVPFIMPTIVVAMGFIALLGPQGLVNSALMDVFGLDTPPTRITNTLLIVFLAHAFYNYSIVVRIVSTFWANLNPRLEESAAMLGAGRFNTFRYVTLPLLLPAIVSSAVLAFAFAFTSFGVVLVLGGSQFATLEVATYELTAKLFRLELAGALAIIQMVFTYAFLLIYTRFQAGAAVRVDLVPHEVTSKGRRSASRTLFLIAIIMGVLAMLSPLWALFERALSSGGGYSFTHFTSLFSNESGSYFYRSPITTIWNSVRFATATMVISLVVGTIVAYFLARPRHRGAGVLDALFMLPLGVSAVIMGFGFLIAFNKDPLDLRASWLILVIAHTLIAYPFVIRSLLPALRGMPIQLQEAAAVLGASPVKTFFHIDLPILSRALLVGATFAFAVSMGEFGASLLLVRPEFTTMPIAIFRLLSQPGATNIGQALAMSSILMVIVAMGFVGIERFRYKDMGGF
jgi:thiamine transport system permease protein